MLTMLRRSVSSPEFTFCTILPEQHQHPGAEETATIFFAARLRVDRDESQCVYFRQCMRGGAVIIVHAQPSVHDLAVQQQQCARGSLTKLGHFE